MRLLARMKFPFIFSFLPSKLFSRTLNTLLNYFLLIFLTFLFKIDCLFLGNKRMLS